METNYLDQIVEIKENIRDLSTSISEMPSRIRSEYRSENRSYDCNELFSALAKSQSEMAAAHKTDVNPFFKSKYAGFAEIIRVSRPVLSKNGLCVAQQIITEDNKTFLMTILGHISGQWISSKISINPVKQDVQELGKYITYLKRYAYAALVGVAVDEEDDDGESHMNRNNSNKYPPKTVEPDIISDDQLAELEHELNEMPDLAQDFLKKMGLQKLEELPKSKYRACIDRIREIKRNSIK